MAAGPLDLGASTEEGLNPAARGFAVAMKFQAHPNSLFARLLRSPWWVSAALAAVLFAMTRLLLSRFDQPGLYAFFVSLPFAVIACWVGAKQLRAPSAAKLAARLEALRALDWPAFALEVEETYRRDGYEVVRLPGPDADFEVAKGGRRALLACKRWKANRIGVEPLKALVAETAARDAHDCAWLAAGELSEAARAYAAQKGVRLIEGTGLALALPAR